MNEDKGLLRLLVIKISRNPHVFITNQRQHAASETSGDKI